MQKRNLALSLLFLTVIVSGCADNGGKVSGNAISVQGPQIQPQKIYEGSTVRVSLSAQNTGKLPGEVIIGDQSRLDLTQREKQIIRNQPAADISDFQNVDRNDILGRKVLTNYCPDFFNVKEFSAYSSRNSKTAASYKLKPGERVQMNWELKQKGGNVPLNGYTCPMRFQLPFNYSVQAYQQIQIKKRDTDTGLKLSSKSSQGPLTILIETIGSSSPQGAPVFLENDRPEVLVQIVNEQPEESVFRGLIRVHNLKISASGVSFVKGCDDFKKPIEINQNQLSHVIRCDIKPVDLETRPSLRGEITVSANYTYIKNLGSRNVKVKYQGGN